jgi:hypothetical protein
VHASETSGLQHRPFLQGALKQLALLSQTSPGTPGADFAVTNIPVSTVAILIEPACAAVLASFATVSDVKAAVTITLPQAATTFKMSSSAIPFSIKLVFTALSMPSISLQSKLRMKMTLWFGLYLHRPTLELALQKRSRPGSH